MAMIEVKDLEKQKKQLKASYEMWERTIKQTIEHMEKAENENKEKKYTQSDIDSKVELLKNGEQDIIDKWFFLGGTMEELEGKAQEEEADGKAKPKVKKKSTEKTVDEQIEEIANKTPKVRKKATEKVNDESIGSSKVSEATSDLIPKMEESNPLASYDIIPLPSKGECYPSKRGRIAVSYLTAIDENIIVSPNLYRDNLVLDILLKEKIRNSDIDPDDLLDGDRDAIILFLRSSAYGNMYAVTTTDPDTKQKFETEIDLSQLKYKEFNLVGDENGYFDFEVPVKKDKIKFKFLSHGDYKKLDLLDQAETPGLRKSTLLDVSSRLNLFLSSDKDITSEVKKDITKAIETIDSWANETDAEATQFSRRVSNELEMSIMSVNGNTDRKFIHTYVENMPIKDSMALRKYISSNMPGVDYHFTINKPESLGGGSMDVFLQFDQFIFLVGAE